ncbi:MAG TPA: FG-GAP-like repeat-containing protein [Candidatus Didemnitutus sp.]|nr:FG-GAP-like repeat-containing protein [Candidatus Didemnitutus sp.]
MAPSKIKHLRVAGLLLLAGLAAGAASGYTFIFNTTTHLPIKWPAGTVSVQIIADNTTTLLDGTTLAGSIQIASQAWNGFLGDEQMNSTINPAGTPGDHDGVNQVSFGSTVYGTTFDADVLAVTTTYASGNRRLESDTVFNTAYTWNSYRDSIGNHPNVQDVRRIATHEFGHAFGLDHPDEATPAQTVSAIMNSHESDIIAPTADDIAGVQQLYGPNPLNSAPANDSFANAATISAGSVSVTTVTGFNVNATKESGEPNHAGDTGGKSVWWKWTAPFNGGVFVDTKGSAFDTLLGVYTGSAVNSLTTIASNDDIDPSIVQVSSTSFVAQKGTTYYFAVDGFNDTSGPGPDSGGVMLNVTNRLPSDFTGDGQADVLWEDTSTGDRSFWVMNGTSLSSFAYLAGIPTDWHIVGKGDFNGDGMPDLVWENLSTGDRTVWLMNGTSLSSFLYLANIPAEWHIAAVADFNGDGKPDLIWEDTLTGDRTVWIMDGANITNMLYLAGIPVEWHIVGAADFNGDGQTDLVWENVNTGDRSMWLMNGTTIQSFDFGVNVPMPWHIAAVADFNGDGHPDLLWENTSTGDRAFWLLNGTSVLSMPYLANIPGEWHIVP